MNNTKNTEDGSPNQCTAMGSMAPYQLTPTTFRVLLRGARQELEAMARIADQRLHQVAELEEIHERCNEERAKELSAALDALGGIAYSATSVPGAIAALRGLYENNISQVHNVRECLRYLMRRLSGNVFLAQTDGPSLKEVIDTIFDGIRPNDAHAERHAALAAMAKRVNELQDIAL